jgi:peptidoglycan/xylan/chitin deacetylase (PgdA/CDA1 family)
MVALLLTSAAHAQEPGNPQSPVAVGIATRSVAFTFDDLPATRLRTLPDAQLMTARLLALLRAHQIPAIGFVNEGKLYAAPGEEEARAALLEAWLDAGLELGNHTYSHLRLYDVSLAVAAWVRNAAR